MSDPTLEDVALRVLQLEPEDHTELGRVHEHLATLALSNRVAIAVQPLVEGAAQALKPLADGTASDPVTALGEVGQLLQRALLASDDGGRRIRRRRPGAW